MAGLVPEHRHIKTHRRTDTHATLRASRARPVLQTYAFALHASPYLSPAGDGSYLTKQGMRRRAHPRPLACAQSTVTAEDGRRGAVNGEPKFQPRHPHTHIEVGGES